MNKKTYIRPEIVKFTLDLTSLYMWTSGETPGQTGPGNSGNAPGHNKDENGHPIHPTHPNKPHGIFDENPFDYTM